MNSDFASLDLDYDETIIGKSHEVGFTNPVITMPRNTQRMQHYPFVAEFSTQALENALFRFIICSRICREYFSHSCLLNNKINMANRIH
jgi:hypothetical protein